MAQAEPIHINCGGSLYVTTSRTLRRAPPASSLHRPDAVLEDGSTAWLFFDRDGPAFAYVLNFLRAKPDESRETAQEAAFQASALEGRAARLREQIAELQELQQDYVEGKDYVEAQRCTNAVSAARKQLRAAEGEAAQSQRAGPSPASRLGAIRKQCALPDGAAALRQLAAEAAFFGLEGLEAMCAQEEVGRRGEQTDDAASVAASRDEAQRLRVALNHSTKRKAALEANVLELEERKAFYKAQFKAALELVPAEHLGGEPRRDEAADAEAQEDLDEEASDEDDS